MDTTQAAQPLDIARDEDVKALLKVAKGPLAIPLFFLIATALFFIVAWLPSGRGVLADHFELACGAVRAAAETAAQDGTALPERSFTPLAAKCAVAGGESVATLRAEFETKNMLTENELQSFTAAEIGGPKGVVLVVISAIKDYLDHVFIGIRDGSGEAVKITLVAALLAVVPGLAGLVYRRAFWSWYLLSFAVILATKAISVNVLNLAGQTSSAMSVSDAAAAVFALIASQLVLIFLVNRLRRHSTKPPRLATIMPPKLFNGMIAAALVAVGLGVLLLGWGHRMWGSVIPGNASLAMWNFVLLGLPFLYVLLRVTWPWTGTGPKNIVICLDGTSNTPDMQEKGLLAQTNVFKLFKTLKSDNGAFAPEGRFDATLAKIYGDRQIGLYYSGIGNTYDNAPIVDTLMQATGLGAAGIIERAYLDLVRVWRPGDRVFITGFSRGAASARILARAIDARGAPQSMWTLRLLGRHWTLWPSKKRQPVKVDVLGVWDTVGSFGVSKTIGGINFQQSNVLHNMTVPDSVGQAYHMVALDEDRQEFEPTLMDPDPIEPERIIEVWFPGSHAGVGGGFATDRLSDVALDFLLRRISSGYCTSGAQTPGDESWGVYLAAVDGMSPAAEERAGKGVFRLYPDARGQMRTSAVSPFFKYRSRKLPSHAVIHESVFERMRTSEPVYAPQALFDLNDALDERRDLIVAKVEKLGETKSLHEAERKALLTYTDKLRLTRWPHYWQSIQNVRKPKPPSAVLANA